MERLEIPVFVRDAMRARGMTDEQIAAVGAKAATLDATPEPDVGGAPDVPPSAYAITCSGCGQVSDSRRGDVWQEVTGWEQPRERGGSGYVALREPSGRWLCGACMTLRRSGAPPTQATLT